MASFKSYDKIATNSSLWDKAYKKVKGWAVTEKVHGANFAFIFSVQDGSFSFAKRNGILRDDELFFGYKSILQQYLPKVTKIVELVMIEYPQAEIVTVFGELFGGKYPGYDSIYHGVQEGVYYSPDLLFYAFDIMVKNGVTQESLYLDLQLSLQVFQAVNILHSEPLAIYTNYEKAIQHPVGFLSTIPRKLGLPDIEGNKAEGIVIRSLQQRYMVKIKIPEFSESKYSENEYVQDTPKDSTLFWLNKCIPHITENRLESAISKVGEFTKDNEEAVLDTLVEDILFEVNGFHKVELPDVLKNHCRERFKNKVIDLEKF